jgi:hypothetical protein
MLDLVCRRALPDRVAGATSTAGSYMFAITRADG